MHCLPDNHTSIQTFSGTFVIFTYTFAESNLSHAPKSLQSKSHNSFKFEYENCFKIEIDVTNVSLFGTEDGFYVSAENTSRFLWKHANLTVTWRDANNWHDRRAMKLMTAEPSKSALLNLELLHNCVLWLLDESELDRALEDGVRRESLTEL